jgi:hypothetical protein
MKVIASCITVSVCIVTAVVWFHTTTTTNSSVHFQDNDVVDYPITSSHSSNSDIVHSSQKQSRRQLNIFANRISADQQQQEQQSSLSSSLPDHYYVTDMNDPTLVPRHNYDIAIGNPMKGLCANPGNIALKDWNASNLPASVGLYKWPLSSFLLYDPDIVGYDNAFNYSFVESRLQEAANYSIHAIIRFFIDYPGQPLRLPSYLLDPIHNLTLLSNNTALYYENDSLKRAIRQSIDAFAQRFDGDSRIFMMQAGFLGRWGEWHTNGCTYNNVSCLPNSVTEEAVQWLSNSFNQTLVQVRYPDKRSAYDVSFGFHDDSYTFATLGGSYNGNSTKTRFFFWNVSQTANTTDFWKRGPMGGEVRPENFDVFQDNYTAGTTNRQDFNTCTEITHATYMAWSTGWKLNGSTRGVNGTELQRAKYATARMGYSFEIQQVAVAVSSSSSLSLSSLFPMVDIDVTIQQTGVAPFYYPLTLNLYCMNGLQQYKTNVSIPVGSLIDYGSTIVSTLQNVPASETCLNAIELQLDSPNTYTNKPIKWSQGLNDGKVIVSIPSIPTQVPSAIPSFNPSTFPSTLPSLRPSDRPSDIPSDVPTSEPTKSPSYLLTQQPTSSVPTLTISTTPSVDPTTKPTTIKPTSAPSNRPSTIPSYSPSYFPSHDPSNIPSTDVPTLPPTTNIPTLTPTFQPTMAPTNVPTLLPTTPPTSAPTLLPTTPPTNAPLRKNYKKPTK